MPAEMLNVISEYVFQANRSRSPLFGLGCLRSCNSTYRNIFSAIIKTEIKNRDLLIKPNSTKLTEETLFSLFGSEHSVFQDIEHIDLSRVIFEINPLRILPSTLKTLRLGVVRSVSIN